MGNRAIACTVSLLSRCGRWLRHPRNNTVASRSNPCVMVKRETTTTTTTTGGAGKGVKAARSSPVLSLGDKSIAGVAAIIEEGGGVFPPIGTKPSRRAGQETPSLVATVVAEEDAFPATRQQRQQQQQQERRDGSRDTKGFLSRSGGRSKRGRENDAPRAAGATLASGVGPLENVSPSAAAVTATKAAATTLAATATATTRAAATTTATTAVTRQSERGQDDDVDDATREEGRRHHRNRRRRRRRRLSRSASRTEAGSRGGGGGGGGGGGVRFSPGLELKEPTPTQNGSADDIDSLVPSFCPSAPFERYVRLHRDIMRGRAEPRYLVYRPYLICGMGNRLSGFQGVLSLAMMTDRALLVDWTGGVPSRSSTVSKYEDNFLEAHGVPHHIIPERLNDYEALPGTEIWCQMPDATRMTTPCDPTRMTPNFLPEATWDTIYAAHASVVLVQGHNGNPMMFLRESREPSVLEALARMKDDFGPDTFRLCALRFLFRAKPEFRQRYCAERSTVLDGKIPSVSLHIRTGDNPDYHPEWYKTLPQDVENFVACATGFDEALLASSTDPDLNLDLQGAETVWLLGTDSDTVIDQLKAGNLTVGHGGKVAFIEGGENHRVHSGSKGGALSTNDGPLMDLAMLSESPFVVGSYHSTFSMHVAELGGVPLPARLVIRTPFASMFGKRMSGDTLQSVHFEDYHQGCRDFVLDPKIREYVKLALRARKEPFIDCERV